MYDPRFQPSRPRSDWSGRDLVCAAIANITKNFIDDHYYEFYGPITPIQAVL
ncbi:hypothetical protein PILCRDRAFT_814395 [Piloderma croceum F 1598]|uniref:Uncharacterized protein n=1 Tax=Piloderma croceum (strain F 1598) TaxID=765440 RepID=A0A0C3BPQ8_PILCF|nr:hypothetical protein PILCRDRAFT_814395 [Piloderma croceum F 1598]